MIFTLIFNSMNQTLLILMLLVISFNSYSAIDEKRFAKCAAVEGDLSRLECFDRLAKQNNLDGPQFQPQSISGSGKWKANVEFNPIDDSKTVTIVLHADSGKSRWGNNISLIARCKSGKTELYINWRDYLGSESYVLTRIGKNKAVTRKWSLSTDSKATFNRDSVSFLKEMLKSPKLVAHTTPYNENPVTATFDTSGLENAIKPLRDTCSW
jgi:type VI secretion system protein VasI